MHLLPKEELEDLVIQIFLALGTPLTNAATVAEHLVEADLRGKHTHGVYRIPRYLSAVREGRIQVTAIPTTDTDEAGVGRVNANCGFGCVAGNMAIKVAVEKARRFNVGSVLMHGCYHAGWLGYYVEQAAREEMIGLVAASGEGVGATIAPTGAAEGALPSCALAIAFPRRNGFPIVLDMGTANGSVGAVWMSKEEGSLLSPGWAIDRDGVPTCDPNDLQRGGALTALGSPLSHKGSALTMGLDLLVGSLSPAGPSQHRFGPSGNALLFQVINITAFKDLGLYEKHTAGFVGHLKSVRTLPGANGVTVPGERSNSLRAARLRDGIPLADATFRALMSSAESLNISSHRT